MGSWRGIENHTESVPDALWRTLIMDRDSDGQIPPTWYQRACLRCLEMADSFNDGDLNIGQLLEGNSDMLRVYPTRVRNTTWNRKFFTADMKPSEAEDACDNGLFGLCPVTTEKDDLICILYGCSVPMILRLSADEEWYKVIGEAYVHGKMDGEAMADFKKEKTSLGEEEEDFDLR
ncbi:hypothetical protein J3459_011895 [Metarhizium acridum]|nr:hypothetical protein J3459_011895 [Metarhizium acridum]